MWRTPDSELDNIFLSYKKILRRFNLWGITTKNGKEITHTDLRKAINVMLKSILHVDGKVFISSKGIEWICKNVFKEKYLELLENKKMELTEKYIKAGYIYGYFLTEINKKVLS